MFTTSKALAFVMLMMTTSMSVAMPAAATSKGNIEVACLFCCNNSCNGGSALV